MSFLLSSLHKNPGFPSSGPRFLICWPPGDPGLHLRKQIAQSHVCLKKQSSACGSFFESLKAAELSSCGSQSLPGRESSCYSHCSLSLPSTPTPHRTATLQKGGCTSSRTVSSRILGTLHWNSFGSNPALSQATLPGRLTNFTVQMNGNHFPSSLYAVIRPNPKPHTEMVSKPPQIKSTNNNNNPCGLRVFLCCVSIRARAKSPNVIVCNLNKNSEQSEIISGISPSLSSSSALPKCWVWGFLRPL